MSRSESFNEIYKRLYIFIDEYMRNKNITEYAHISYSALCDVVATMIVDNLIQGIHSKSISTDRANDFINECTSSFKALSSNRDLILNATPSALEQLLHDFKKERSEICQ